MENSPSRLFNPTADKYNTPTSAHISRFRPNSRITPLSFPVIKPISNGQVGQKSPSLKVQTFANYSRRRSTKANASPGFPIWQDVQELHGENPVRYSPRARDGKRSVTYPAMKEGYEAVFTGSPARRRMISEISERSEVLNRRPLTPRAESNPIPLTSNFSLQTQRPHKERQSPITTSFPDSPLKKVHSATYEPSHTEKPCTPRFNRPTPIDLANMDLAASPLPPMTPSGGLRAKSKFIARQSLGIKKSLIGRLEREDSAEGEETEVDEVEDTDTAGGSWVTENEALSGTQLAVTSQISSVAAASQTITIGLEDDLPEPPTKPIPPSEAPMKKPVRRSARLSAESEKSRIPPPLLKSAGMGNDPFGDDVTPMGSPVRSTITKKNCTANGGNLSPVVARLLSPKPVSRRRKRSSEAGPIANVLQNSMIPNQSPNPRARKTARKSVVVEIHMQALGSPMKGVRGKFIHENQIETPKNKGRGSTRRVPATDRPARRPRHSNSSSSASPGTDSTQISNKSGKRRVSGARKSLGSHLDRIEREERGARSTSAGPKRLGRKSLRRQSVRAKSTLVLEEPEKPTSDSEDPLLLMGSQKAPGSVRSSRTPRPVDQSQRLRSVEAFEARYSVGGRTTIAYESEEEDFEILPQGAVGKSIRDSGELEEGSDQEKTKRNSPGDERQREGSSTDTQKQASDEKPEETTYEEADQITEASGSMVDQVAPPRSSSPAFPEMREYTPDRSDWQPIGDFTVFGAGACDSSPAPTPQPPPRIWRIAPSHLDFTQATASTPSNEPLSKRRISTPHHGPIPSSSPARSIDASFQDDGDSGSEFEAANETALITHQRVESTQASNTAQATALEADETTRDWRNAVEAPTNTIGNDSQETVEADDESSSDTSDEAEGDVEESQEYQVISKTTTENLAADRYVTLKAITSEIIKIETPPASPRSSEMESPFVYESAVTSTIQMEVIQTNTVTSSALPVSNSNESLITEKHGHPGDSDMLDYAVDSAARTAKDSTQDNQRLNSSILQGGQDDETFGCEVPAIDMEFSIGDLKAPYDRNSTEDDYTNIPITISSQDPRAAALAAAILRRSQRYIQAGTVSATQQPLTKNLKRRRSQFFASAQMAASLTPDQLMREAEIELSASVDTVSEYPRRATSSLPSARRPNDVFWDRKEWQILNRCYRRAVKEDDPKGKRRELDSITHVNVDRVIELFITKMGILPEQLVEGKWNRVDIEARISKLRRFSRQKRSSQTSESLSSTERATSSLASPAIKKAKISHTISNITRIEKIHDKPEEPVATGSWWKTMGTTLKRIASSVTMASNASPALVEDIPERHQQTRSTTENLQKKAKTAVIPEPIQPRRSIPGGLESLPIDTPERARPRRIAPLPSPSSGRKTAHRSLQHPKGITDVIPPTPMTQVNSRRATVFDPEHIVDTGSQRSTALKALFASGASTHHFSTVPSPLTQSTSAPSLSQSTSSARAPIKIPRSSLGAQRESLTVKDLVKSFEEAAERSMSSIEGDLSLRDSTRRTSSTDHSRRRSGLYEH